MDTVQFQKSDIVSFRKRGYLGVDMHFHTQYSIDGLSKIPLLLKQLKKSRIGVAITDHNTTQGVQKIKARDSKAFVIPGIEVTDVRGAHTIYYFYHLRELVAFEKKELKPFRKKNPFITERTSEEILEASLPYNCLRSIPHPYCPGYTGLGSHIPLTKKILRHVHFIEGFNGYNLHHLNVKAINLAKKSKLSLVGGTDGHTVAELGRVLTFVEGETVETFLDAALKHKNIIMGREDTLYKRLLLTFEKEVKSIRTSEKRHIERKRLAYQFKEEFNHIEEDLKKDEKILMHYLKHHH